MKALDSTALSVVGALVLTIASTGFVFGQGTQKQKLAEEAADRIIKRFQETLDFGEVFREEYVKNQRVRQAEVNIIVGNMVRQGDDFSPSTNSKRAIDDAAMERAYIAIANFHWISVAAFRTYDGDKGSFDQETDAAFTKFYQPMNDKSNWPILTAKELDDRITARMNSLAQVFKRYVVKTNFGSQRFKSSEAALEESKKPDPLDKLKELFVPYGLSPGDTIYLTRRGNFYIYLVEEDGVFRMLSYGDRIRF